VTIKSRFPVFIKKGRGLLRPLPFYILSFILILLYLNLVHLYNILRRATMRQLHPDELHIPGGGGWLRDKLDKAGEKIEAVFDRWEKKIDKEIDRAVSKSLKRQGILQPSPVAQAELSSTPCVCITKDEI
jgi:hypothetical protein